MFERLSGLLGYCRANLYRLALSLAVLSVVATPEVARADAATVQAQVQTYIGTFEIEHVVAAVIILLGSIVAAVYLGAGAFRVARAGLRWLTRVG